LLHEAGVKLYATGGTQDFIEKLKIPVTPVESVTDYPSIFGGRVKTLHPKVFGGILHRRGHEEDIAEAEKYTIPAIDLVVVDLYPFEETIRHLNADSLSSGEGWGEAIEKIDIGGISLIRAAAKNFNDVLIIPSREQYSFLLDVLQRQSAATSLEQRKLMAAHAFNISSHYDTAIFNFFNSNNSISAFKKVFSHRASCDMEKIRTSRGYFMATLKKCLSSCTEKKSLTTICWT
jgi:phosphoribosylaminoimidazolecarboxamide formyltransferase/IMP cyclohydrolase